jgi:hypothetical protein
MPSYPSSVHWPPDGAKKFTSLMTWLGNAHCGDAFCVGYVFVKTFTKASACTGYYQLEAFSVGVCQINVSAPTTSFMYTNIQEGVNSLYFTVDLRVYSDSACTVVTSATREAKIYSCSYDDVTGLPEAWGHSTYITEYPTGFVIA